MFKDFTQDIKRYYISSLYECQCTLKVEINIRSEFLVPLRKPKIAKNCHFLEVVKMSKHDSMHTIFLSFISDDQDTLSKKYLQLFLNNRTVLPAGNFKKKNDEPSFPV